MTTTPEPRFATLAALRAHLAAAAAAHPTDTPADRARAARLAEYAGIDYTPGKTLVLPKGRRLAVISEGRGRWHVATPARLLTLTTPCPNKKAALALAAAVEAALPDFPWDGDDVTQHASGWRAPNGDRLTEAINRIRAGVPEADRDGWAAEFIRHLDEGRVARAAYEAAENADGYTEPVKVADVQPGDEISFKYLVHRRKGRYTFPGLPLANDDSDSIIVRGTVTGEGRLMTRSGNNYDEGVDGLRFPMADAVWLYGGATGPVRGAPTTWWLTSVRRRPAAAQRTRRSRPAA